MCVRIFPMATKISMDCVCMHDLDSLLTIRVETNAIEEEAQLRREIEDELQEIHEEFQDQYALDMQFYNSEFAKWKEYEDSQVICSYYYATYSGASGLFYLSLTTPGYIICNLYMASTMYYCTSTLVNIP